MASLLERKLIVLTGKGGAGKSTIAGALGVLSAGRGLRTLVVEVGERSHLAALFGVRAEHGVEVELEPGLWSLSLDPDRALIEWMRDLGGPLSARVLASSSSFQYFAAAAPGAKELVSLVKLHDLSGAGSGRYDLVVLDAPATGHALAMLTAPRTFMAIVRSGPLARRAANVQELLENPELSAYVAVARASELAVAETLELELELRSRLQRELEAVVVNGTIARRFSPEELARIAALTNGKDPLASSPAALAAVRAARAADERSRTQRRQIDRLRRGHAADEGARSVVGVPFAFVPQLDRAVLGSVAARLARGDAFS